MTAVRRRPLPTAVLSGLLAVLMGAATALGGCTRQATTQAPPPQAPPASSASPTPQRPFTVATTERFRQADPAAATTAMSTALVLNVFQRLMTAPAGQAVPKTDAAQECLYETSTLFVCTLQTDLYFQNGHRLTSSDVKFSIDRARRLDVPGSSASLLGALKSISTPDDLTVRFTLSRPDTHFAYALASPAASIVDEQLYDPRKVRPVSRGVVGSGPFLVGAVDGSVTEFTRYGQYMGPNGAALAQVDVQVFPEPGSVEDAMTSGSVDAVWRGLSQAARSRLDEQRRDDPDGRTDGGYTALDLDGTRVFRLEWNPRSRLRSDADLRAAVVGLLQESRTLDSIVPDGVDGHSATFDEGGNGGANITWRTPVELTLGYDPQVPDGADRAAAVRSRLEASGAIRVRLVADPAFGAADLTLVDRLAWTSTAVAWSQAYLDAPAIGSTVRVAQLLADYGRATSPDEAHLYLTEIQKQAAADQVVVPVSQEDDQVFLHGTSALAPTAFGPGWQLGLWGFTR